MRKVFVRLFVKVLVVLMVIPTVASFTVLFRNSVALLEV